MDGGAERTIMAGGCVLVMMEFEGERERYQKQREEERQFPVREHQLPTFKADRPVARNFYKYSSSWTVRPDFQSVFLGRVTLISRTRFRRASFVTNVSAPCWSAVATWITSGVGRS